MGLLVSARAVRWFIAGAPVTVALASCGGNELTYVGNADSQGMYFTVPSTWHGYDATQLAVAESVWAHNGTVGPLVDGTQYANPEFRSDLESYHSRDVEVHHMRLGPPPALPQLPIARAAARTATPEV